MYNISISKSPEENFILLANRTAIATVEYENAYKGLTNAAIPSKISALKVIALAIVIFSLLVAATIGMTPSVLLMGSAMFPAIGAKYLSDRRVEILSVPQCEMATIVNNIIDKLNQLQLDKEEKVVKDVNNEKQYSYKDNPQGLIGYYAKEYSKKEDGLIIPYYSQPSLEERRVRESVREYSKWLPYVEKILLKSNPPTFPLNKWKELQKSCFIFRFGKGNDDLFRAVASGSDINTLASRLKPYVKIVRYGNGPYNWHVEKY